CRARGPRARTGSRLIGAELAQPFVGGSVAVVVFVVAAGLGGAVEVGAVRLAAARRERSPDADLLLPRAHPGLEEAEATKEPFVGRAVAVVVFAVADLGHRGDLAHAGRELAVGAARLGALAALAEVRAAGLALTRRALGALLDAEAARAGLALDTLVLAV